MSDRHKTPRTFESGYKKLKTKLEKEKKLNALTKKCKPIISFFKPTASTSATGSKEVEPKNKNIEPQNVASTSSFVAPGRKIFISPNRQKM